jgi:hypothetical protein
MSRARVPWVLLTAKPGTQTPAPVNGIQIVAPSAGP